MAKKLVLKPFIGLPCELEVFTINSQLADIDDFGNGDDIRENLNMSNFDSDIVCYGCCNRVWKRDVDRKELVMDKYNLTEKEWDRVCKQLESKLSIGECGWCI